MGKLLSLMLLLCLCTSSAQAEDVMPSSVTITYAGHPQVQRFIPLIEESYHALGIKTHMRPTPAERALIELNQGRVEADVIRLAMLIQDFDNIVPVPPMLGEVNYLLLCQKSSPCSTDLMWDPTKTGVVSSHHVNYLQKRYQGRIKAHLYTMHMSQDPVNMLAKGRVDFALYVWEAAQSENQYAHQFNQIVLFQTPAYHVINRKYAFLIPQLSEQISKNLAILSSKGHP